MKILVINGPSLNLLGIREPEIYGKQDYKYLCDLIDEKCCEMNVKAEIFQSNHEGDIIDKICEAYKSADGIIINPAAYTHTSIAIADALKAVNIPYVEVHISDILNREEYRKISYISPNALAVISGKGVNGYIDALNILLKEIQKNDG